MTTEEPKQGEMPEPKVETPEQPAKKETEIVAESKDAKELEAELEKARKALKEANKEAAERRKKIEEFEAAEAKRKEAEMSEAEKLQARLKQFESEKAELQAQLKLKERQELQRKVALAVGLPEALASRLTGEDEEALTADAKAILELLPKQEPEKKPAAPKLDATNPGNAVKGETRQQVKERVFGSPTNAWGKGTVSYAEDK